MTRRNSIFRSNHPSLTKKGRQILWFVDVYRDGTYGPLLAFRSRLGNPHTAYRMVLRFKEAGQ